MKLDRCDEPRARIRFQFRVRTLLILMLVLGPLSGWYGPSIVTQLRDLVANDSPTNPPVTPSLAPNRIQLEQRMMKQMIADHRAALQRRNDETGPIRKRGNLRVNWNGTFNMRLHIPPSEQ